MLLAALAFAGEDDADVLATRGDVLPGAIVERVELHAEYHRYWLRYTEGGLLPAELTRSADGHQGICEAHGLTFYAREDLAEGARPADALPAVRALCERLDAHPVLLRARVGGETSAPPVLRLQPLGLHAAVVAWLLALVAVAVGPARRTWMALPAGEKAELLGVALLGVAVRLALAPVGVFNGGGAAYEKIVLAWGLDTASPYGDGYPALFGPLLAVLGRDPAWVFAIVRIWACAAPPALWVAARLLPGGSRGSALVAGLVLALLPLHVGMSATEAMHVVVLTLELGAMAAAARAGASPVLALLAALSAGLAAHTRPEAMAFAVVPFVLLLASRSRAGWIGAAVLVGLVAAAVPGVSRPQGVVQGATFLDPALWGSVLRLRFGEPVEARAFSVFLHGGLTPPVLWAFALAGLVLAPWRLRGLVLLWWAGTELPVIAKVLPLADAWRLQLVAQPAWILLVAAGAAALGRWTPWLVGGCLAIVLVRAPPGPDWAHQREFALLARTVPTLRPDDVVIFDDAATRSAKFRRVMEELGPARWVPASTWLSAEDSRGPTLVFLGLGCLDSELCARVRRRCTLDPFVEERLGPPADVDVHLPEGGAPVGLYRVSSCRG